MYHMNGTYFDPFLYHTSTSRNTHHQVMQLDTNPSLTLTQTLSISTGYWHLDHFISSLKKSLWFAFFMFSFILARSLDSSHRAWWSQVDHNLILLECNWILWDREHEKDREKFCFCLILCLNWKFLIFMNGSVRRKLKHIFHLVFGIRLLIWPTLRNIFFCQTHLAQVITT